MADFRVRLVAEVTDLLECYVTVRVPDGLPEDEARRLAGENALIIAQAGDRVSFAVYSEGETEEARVDWMSPAGGDDPALVPLASEATVFDALERLSAERQAEILGKLRLRAVDEGCRMSEVCACVEVEEVCGLASWDDDDLAEILGQLVPDLFTEAGFYDEEAAALAEEQGMEAF